MTSSDGLTRALECARAALDKKAVDLVVLDVGALTSIADYLVICTGKSDRQVQAIAQAIETELREQGERPIAIEGMSRGQWVLLDCADVIVHVFYKPVREFYDLERLWEHAPRVQLPEPLRTQALGFNSESAAL
ncbi:MAG: ribosome silencing factor [Candidatus Binatia bacterium]